MTKKTTITCRYSKTLSSSCLFHEFLKWM